MIDSPAPKNLPHYTIYLHSNKMRQLKLVFTTQVWQHLNVQKTKFVASENIAEEPQAFWLFEKLAQI